MQDYKVEDLINSIINIAENTVLYNWNLLTAELWEVKVESSFIFLSVNTQFSQHHLLKRQSFLHWVFLAGLSNI